MPRRKRLSTLLRHRLVPGILRLLRKAVDRLLALIGVVLLSPLFLIVALAIKIDSRGPIFYRQKRVAYSPDGRKLRIFNLLKFRSMYRDSDERRRELLEQHGASGGVRFKLKHDPRITRVGRFLRKFSIDELPQLFNVLRGDLMLVGPRPPLPEEVAAYDADARKRLLAPQGITCLWQVGGRSKLSFEEQVELDKEYVLKRGTGMDLKILAKTVPAVLKGDGAE